MARSAVTASSLPSSSVAGGSWSDGAASNYVSALDEFASSKMDRQVAGLKSTAGRVVELSHLVVERHRAALEMALEHAEHSGGNLTPDDLSICHAAPTLSDLMTAAK